MAEFIALKWARIARLYQVLIAFCISTVYHIAHCLVARIDAFAADTYCYPETWGWSQIETAIGCDQAHLICQGVDNNQCQVSGFGEWCDVHRWVLKPNTGAAQTLCFCDTNRYYSAAACSACPSHSTPGRSMAGITPSAAAIAAASLGRCYVTGTFSDSIGVYSFSGGTCYAS